MPCPTCRADNPAHARFCIACGGRLTRACPGCQADVPDGARFCPACGHALAATPPPEPARAPHVYTPPHLADRILTSRAALQGERKPVTVLFCDLVGSTALAERLGADAMHDLLNRFFEAALAEVHRYEGTVNQFLGDGFMALFGAPIAHEDHARRAVLAALSVARAVSERPFVLETGAQAAVTVRMGLHTGLVVVGAIGDNLRMDYTAVGDTTHLAARLQQAAAPGTILVSAATARLVEGRVVLEPSGTLALRGLTAPVTAYRLVSAGAPAAALAEAGRRARARFVGRDAPLTTLRALLGDAQAGLGRVAGLVGEPGLGKSRLLLEFRRTVGDTAACLEAGCVSYGAAIPYLPVLELLRGACGLTDVDPPERAADKVRATLDDAGMSGAERGPYLLHLLGLKEADDLARALGGDVLHARTLETLRQLWLRTSRRRPLVLLVEDLHWIDAASEACLASLADSLAGAHILLVATYRPGYRPPWIDRSYATQMSLAPLRRDESLAILRSLMPALATDDTRTAVVLDKAEGNPFFLEELVHAVGDGGEDRLAVPDSVQGVLAARIDRLSDGAKHLLQTASVLDREFPEHLLRRIADAPERLDDHLSELARLEFLHERPDADERAWVFKHALTQDVAHRTLVASRRRLLHRRAAEALLALAPGREAELAPRLAHHYLEAEAWAEAAVHARRAAETARAAWANREALARYDQALLATTRAAAPDTERRALLEARADVHAALGRFDPAREDLDSALALARSLDDRVGEGRILVALGALWSGHRDYARGLALTREALAVIPATETPGTLAAARAQLGVMLLNVVRMGESRVELEAALAMFRKAGDDAGEAGTLEMLAMNRWLAGDAAAALVILDEALPRLRALGNRRSEVTALVSLGAARAWTERLSAGQPFLLQALEIARGMDARGDEALARAALADFGMSFGAWALAHREAGAALAIARELGHREWLAYALSGVGRVHAACGDPDEARRLHEEELAVAREAGGAIWIADALGHLGTDLLVAGELEAARRRFEEAIITAGECAEKAVFPLLGLGDLALCAGRAEEALAVMTRFHAIGDGYPVLALEARRIEAEARAALGHDTAEELADIAREADARESWPTRARAVLARVELLRRAGRRDEAHGEARATLLMMERVGAELPDALARTFRDSAPMRRARALAA